MEILTPQRQNFVSKKKHKIDTKSKRTRKGKLDHFLNKSRDSKSDRKLGPTIEPCQSC